jgi:hypothetical protein
VDGGPFGGLLGATSSETVQLAALAVAAGLVLVLALRWTKKS